MQNSLRSQSTGSFLNDVREGRSPVLVPRRSKPMPRTLVNGLIVYTTADWGARPPLHQFALTTPTLAVVHHMESANRKPLQGDAERQAAFDLARSTQAFHMGPKRNWSDSGQHWTISRGGLVLEGRHGSLAALLGGNCVVGAHSPGANSDWGTEHEGSYTKANGPAMPDQQWAATVALHAALTFYCKIDSASMHGHRDFISTTCPGDYLYARLAELRAAVHQAKLAIMQANP
jgi:hypothetical protein